MFQNADGVGNRFLAADARDNVELNTHDIETFEDSGSAYVAPVIDCASATVVSGQYIKDTNGNWYSASGDVWDFDDYDSRYDFQNVNTVTSPTRWESCSISTILPTCTAADWHPLGTYPAAHTVTYNGRTWSNSYWANPGDPPGSAAMWQDQGGCRPRAPGACTAISWVSTVNYQDTAVVAHNSRRWQARWWANAGETPGTAQVWRDLGVCNS